MTKEPLFWDRNFRLNYRNEIMSKMANSALEEILFLERELEIEEDIDKKNFVIEMILDYNLRCSKEIYRDYVIFIIDNVSIYGEIIKLSLSKSIDIFGEDVEFFMKIFKDIIDSITINENNYKNKIILLLSIIHMYKYRSIFNNNIIIILNKKIKTLNFRNNDKYFYRIIKINYSYLFMNEYKECNVYFDEFLNC